MTPVGGRSSPSSAPCGGEGGDEGEDDGDAKGGAKKAMTKILRKRAAAILKRQEAQALGWSGGTTPRTRRSSAPPP